MRSKAAAAVAATGETGVCALRVFCYLACVSPPSSAYATAARAAPALSRCSGAIKVTVPNVSLAKRNGFAASLRSYEGRSFLLSFLACITRPCFLASVHALFRFSNDVEISAGGCLYRGPAAAAQPQEGKQTGFHAQREYRVPCACRRWLLVFQGSHRQG